MTREKSSDSTRPLTERLIVDGLGYCCPWVFFKFFKRKYVIALRLGVTPRTVNNWKAKVRDGEIACTKCDKCMMNALKERDRRRKGL